MAFATPSKAVSTYANRKRWLGADHPETITARADHAAAAIAHEIGRRLAGEITLTDSQVTELTGLLRGRVA